LLLIQQRLIDGCRYINRQKRSWWASCFSQPTVETRFIATLLVAPVPDFGSTG